MANVKSITTKLPTYLELLLQNDCSITLVFQEGEKPQESPVAFTESNILEVTEEIHDLDLTGRPLETDLGGDDTVCADAILEKPHSWTSQEASQHPLTLNNVRNLINDQLQSRKLNKTIYCICDGTDQKHTVGLGAMSNPHKVSRILVYVLPCCCEGSDITTLDGMMLEHLKNIPGKVNTQVEVSSGNRKHYNLFGYDLSNCLSLQDAEHNGHMFVEVSTNDRTQSNTAYVQVVVGHKDSPLISFWEDLCVIQSYVKFMGNVKTLNDGTVINLRDNVDHDEIRSLISDLFISTSVKKPLPQTLDLKNLRRLNIIDSLWIILKQCKTVSDLRDSFHFFFEEIAQQQTRILLPTDINSTVAEIIRGILNGRVAVPALSFLQSLELLVELGLEKVKSDHLAILTSFSNIAKEAYLNKWNELSSNESIYNSNVSSQSRTRTTITRKSVITDVTSTNFKLTFLDSMHKVAEFMYLFKECLPSEKQIFDLYCEALSDQWILKFPKIIQSCDFKQARLCKFHFNIPPADAKVLIKDKSPSAFTFTLRTTVHSSEVSTVLHFSENPIIPPCVFHDYEIPDVDNEIQLLYVTKLVKLVENV